MSSDRLKKAREYEKEAELKYGKDNKPVYHLAPLTGWMNDPNGFSVFDGKYHLFYQYNPYSIEWSSMHWGHACTEDFLHWEYLPAAMAPDQPYDADGVFSGSAIERNGKHVLMYTAVQETENPDHSKTVRQTQGIAIGDGQNYEKLKSNPVITADMLPEGCSKVDFRDPKIWEEDGTCYCVVGSRPADGSGQILLFSSEDLEHWQFRSVVDSCRHEYGKMWECPDLFPLGDRHVLIVSPQDMLAEGLEFHNGNGTVMFTGQFDKETGKFQRESAHAVDYGLDFYAPQTVAAPDGRRIMIGWMKSWDVPLHVEGTRWNGMMTVPRELELKDGKVIQNPVRELESLRKNPVVYEETEFREEENGQQLEGIQGRTVDLTVDLESGEYESFEIRIAQNRRFYSSILYDPKQSVLTFDRTYAGICRDFLAARKMKVKDQNGRIRIRILMDLYSAEIFVNDGEQAMTSLITTPQDAQEISFYIKGSARGRVEKYEIQM